MRPALVLLALVLAAPAAGAQTMRSMSVSRQLHGEKQAAAWSLRAMHAVLGVSVPSGL